MNRNALGLLFLVGTVFLVGRKKSGRLKRGIVPIKAKVSSGFGNRIHPITKKVEFHNGVDLSTKEGTTVLASWDGTVIKVYYAEKGGNQLVIRYDNGYTLGYAHLSKSLVKVGEKVKRGDSIALTGNTGKSTGPHLHLTVRDPENNYVDPEKVFKFSKN